MFKKIVLVAIALILIIPLCFANNIDTPATTQPTPDKKIIGIFFEAPATYVNNEDTKKNVQKKVAELFPANKFTILPLDAIIVASEAYRKDNEMTPDEPLVGKDIRKIAAGLNCNYVLRINMANTPSRIEIEFPSVSSRSDITCSVGLMDAISGNYLVAVEVINKGKRDATLDRDALFGKSYSDTFNKALKALEIDVNTL